MTTSQTTFCIVTPNFNMGRYLAETIESVLANLRPGDEYFVIDGGSSDDSVAIIKSYADRLSGWVSEPDAGYGDALAKGFGRSHTAFQCWINSGDLLLAGALDVARARLSRGDEDLLFGDDFYVDEQSRVISFSRGEVRCLRNAMLYAGWTPLQDACFWTRTLYEKVGGIDRDLKHAADYDLFLRFAVNGRTCYVPCTFSAFRRHAGQKSVAQYPAYALERRHCRKKVLAELGENDVAGNLKSLWHGTAIRYRVHVRQRLWGSPCSLGTPVATLTCKNYQNGREALK